MKYLACLFLLLTTVPVVAQDTLLKKQPDGSILITPENAWAILRGRYVNYQNSYQTDDRMANALWGNQLLAIKDEFARHAAAEDGGRRANDCLLQNDPDRPVG
jgi:hypothetical protein